MKKININSWERKSAYKCFSRYQNPTFSLSTKIDVTNLVNYSKKTGTSFFANTLFVVTKALNSIDEFRIRIHKNKVVLFDKIDASFIVLNQQGAIISCRTNYTENYNDFYAKTRSLIDSAKTDFSKKNFNDNGDNNLFYFTCLPWVDFTSLSHPYNYRDKPRTSIPRISWGKYVFDGKKYLMTLDFCAHHALLDGYHFAKGFTAIQDTINNLENYLK